MSSEPIFGCEGCNSTADQWSCPRSNEHIVQPSDKYCKECGEKLCLAVLLISYHVIEMGL